MVTHTAICNVANNYSFKKNNYEELFSHIADKENVKLSEVYYVTQELPFDSKTFFYINMLLKNLCLIFSKQTIYYFIYFFYKWSSSTKFTRS